MDDPSLAPDLSEIRGILRAPKLIEAAIACRRCYAPNQLIIEKGREDRCLYLIERGLVRVIGHIGLDDSRRIQIDRHL